MMKTKHTYIVNVDIDVYDCGKCETISYNQHLPGSVSMSSVFETSYNMAKFIMDTILENEEDE